MQISMNDSARAKVRSNFSTSCMYVYITYIYVYIEKYQANCIHYEIRYEDTVMSLSTKFSLGIYFHWMAFQNVISRQKTVHTIAFHLSTLQSREVVANNKHQASTNKRARKNEIENKSKEEKKKIEKRWKKENMSLSTSKCYFLYDLKHNSH